MKLSRTVKRELSRGLVRFGLNTGVAFLVALGWKLSLSKDESIKSREIARKTLIVLAKSAGVEDLHAAFRYKKAGYRIRLMPRQILKQSYNAYIFSSGPSHDDEDSEKQRHEDSVDDYCIHLEKVLNQLERMIGRIGFLQFNIMYEAEIELSAACANLGIPFVVNYKECLRTVKAWRDSEDYFRSERGVFSGYKLGVYNKHAAKTLVRADVADWCKLEVTGCARLDFTHEKRIGAEPNRQKPIVLYYLVQERACLPTTKGKGGKWIRGVFDRQGREYTWAPMIKKLNEAVIEAAIRCPDVTFILKGKTGFAEEQLAGFEDELPDNCKVIKGGVGHYLLEAVHVVIGFNSTAILESIAAGIPTVVPNFLDDGDPLNPYILELEDAVFRPTCKSELGEIIVQQVRLGARNKELNVAQKEVLDRYLGNSDGKAGERLRAILDIAMNVSRKEVIDAGRYKN